MSQIYRNAFFIGERVEWSASEKENRSSGTGIVAGLYGSPSFGLIYRVERDELDRERHRLYELLEPGDLWRAEEADDHAVRRPDA